MGLPSIAELREMLPENVSPERVRDMLIGFLKDGTLPTLIEKAIYGLEGFGIPPETIEKILTPILERQLNQGSAKSTEYGKADFSELRRYVETNVVSLLEFWPESTKKLAINVLTLWRKDPTKITERETEVFLRSIGIPRGKASDLIARLKMGTVPAKEEPARGEEEDKDTPPSSTGGIGNIIIAIILGLIIGKGITSLISSGIAGAATGPLAQKAPVLVLGLLTHGEIAALGAVLVGLAALVLTIRRYIKRSRVKVKTVVRTHAATVAEALADRKAAIERAVRKAGEKVAAAEALKIQAADRAFKFALQGGGNATKERVALEKAHRDAAEAIQRAEREAREAEMAKDAKAEEEQDLIKIISEYILRIGESDKGPGAIRTPTEGETHGIYNAVNLLRKESIQIIVPRQLRLTSAIRRIRRDIERREGKKVIDFEEYNTEEDLKRILEDEKQDKDVKRIIITEDRLLGYTAKSSNHPVRKLAESSPGLFRDVRLLNTVLPGNYQSLSRKDQTMHQARIIMIAILARLFEKDEKGFAEMALRAVLKDHLGSIDLDKFLDRLGKSEEIIPTDEIRDRIIYFLDTPVSLIQELEKELRFLEKFWISA
jgi:hypothetical protein